MGERLARLEEQMRSINELLTERDKQVALAFASIEKATQKAEEAQQRVNITQNEFRGALKDQAGFLATKSDLEAAADKATTADGVLAARISILEQKVIATAAKGEGQDKGREPLNAIWMTVVAAVVGAVVTFVAVRLNG